MIKSCTKHWKRQKKTWILSGVLILVTCLLATLQFMLLHPPNGTGSASSSAVGAVPGSGVVNGHDSGVPSIVAAAATSPPAPMAPAVPVPKAPPPPVPPRDSQQSAHTRPEQSAATPAQPKPQPKPQPAPAPKPKPKPKLKPEASVNLPMQRQHFAPRQRAPIRAAFAITMTADSGSRAGGTFHDGAAVLAYSILKAVHEDDDVKGLFASVSFVAFVHESVSASNRALLQSVGYKVIVAQIPVNASAVDGEFLREKINKNGCCGAAELIKLHAYRLTAYDIVLHLDADTFFIPRSPNGGTGGAGAAGGFTHSLLYDLFHDLLYPPPEQESGRDGGFYSLVYTTDPNMATFKAAESMPVQGGFISFRPNITDYDEVVNIVMHTDFVKNYGWARSRIGWFWGGMTIQGVLPYYYNAVTAPNRTRIIDRCVYNSMADTAPCVANKTLEHNDVVSAHFTVCQKPWACYEKYWRNRPNEFNAGLCAALHERWFALRREAEVYYNIPVTPSCTGRGYVPMELTGATTPLSRRKAALRGEATPVMLQNTVGVRIPGVLNPPGLLKDDEWSPDELFARPGSGFESIKTTITK